MQKESIATVSERERQQILALHERRTALKELFLTLRSPFLKESERQELRDNLIEAFTQTNAQYERWWREIQAKYAIQPRQHIDLTIDFETRKICYSDQTRREEHDCELEIG